MHTSDLEIEYEQLYEELEAAYAAPEWDSGKIDRIANSLARLEQASMRDANRLIFKPSPHPTDWRHS